ncbi:ATP-binding protein [Actinocrispum wychmicini]|uniref:Putative HTH transcriptional regulator n=1 Tax=Actinocrispum wychmicini TaxID=1213861 RepID=A0A4R2K3B8_9PSEU|nr:ATP-binding protein [Actinocrispum wychmicini]TCO64249.1 putative HTH transcriptional regulator [Actinocrispum wychmicini]
MSAKVGNEDLIAWLTRQIHPQVHFEFKECEIDGKRLVILEVAATHASPVRFKDFEYIRIGSYKKKLRDHPDHARRLWAVFNEVSFEDSVAMSALDGQEVVDLIDYPSYFTLLKRRLPDGLPGILEGLSSDSIIHRTADSDDWNISNLGAVLFARNLSDFPSLKRKALRIIRYAGNNRISGREQLGVKGYASGFAGAVRYLNGILPMREVMGEALRVDVEVYPPITVRELLANALVHQGFSQSGNAPMVEVFDNRVELTNPGLPLVDPARFVDAPPKSRNERLASLMRRAGVCEERGSGWDKIAVEVELNQLPAPKVELPSSSTRVILFGPKTFQDMDKAERLRAAYLHACLRYVAGEQLTNASLRERFGLDQSSGSQISRLISDAVDDELITPFDPTANRRFMKYVPAWSVDGSNSL